MEHITEELRGDQLPYEWFSVTLKSIGDAVIATDNKGLVIFMNYIAQTLTGWHEEAIGRALPEIFNIASEITGKKAEDPVGKVLRDGKVAGLANHTILIAKDGKRIPIDDSAAPIKDSKGALLGVVLIFRDITERRKREDALRLLSAIVESSDDAIYSKTLDGTILSWNKAAEKMYGYSREEIIGRNVSLIVPPDLLNELPDICKKLERGERVEHYETKRRRKDGGIIDVSVSISCMKDEEGNIVGVAAIVRDITVRKNMEEELKKKMWALETFNKVAVGRELKMAEQKKRISELETRLKDRSE